MIVIEDGTGKATADAYASYAEYVAYWTARGAVPAEVQATIEAALLKATAYIDGAYRKRWQGCRTYPLTQALEFPRFGVVVDPSGAYLAGNVIPTELKQATFEAAKRALSGDLAADMTNAGVKREKVDVIETEYFSPTPSAVKYQVIDQLLGRFLKSGNDVLRG
jgi:hypothetical protein